MTDDDRIAYLLGDEPASRLDPGDQAGLDDLRDLLSDPAVWADPEPGLEDRIVAAISAAPSVGAPAVSEMSSRPTSGSAVGAAGTTGAPAQKEAAGSHPPSPRRRRILVAVGALAAAVAIVVGISVGLGNSGDHPLTYHAALAGTDLAPEASAQVTLTQTLSGWQIRLRGTGLPRLDNGQYYQAWLKNAAGVLVPIGTFNQPNDVTLWAGVAPTQFPIVTVTRQQANGNPASSGLRVLTGTSHPG